jgi:membrane protease YdiL (CAAX protease family)
MQPQAPKMQQPELKSVATTLEWRGIGIFLLVTFGLTWAVWAVVYLLGGAENLPLFTVGSLVAMWCPGIAAIICSRYVTPMSKRDLGLQRGYLERYVSIYFFVFLFLIAAMGLSVGLGFQEVNATLEPLSSEIADQQYPFNDPILAVFISIVLSFTLAALFNSVFALGEELGWRGYLLAKLAPIGLGRASILIGIIWGVWHAPAIFMGLNYPGHPFLGVLMMIWFTIGWSVVLTWLREVTQSVLSAAFGHGLINAVASLPLLLLLDTDSLIRAPLGITGLVPLSLIALLAFGLLQRREREGGGA